MFCMRNWAQCDRCHCWRLLLPACAARARGNECYKVRDTDLDWEEWLRGAADRCAGAVAASADQDAALGEEGGDAVKGAMVEGGDGAGDVRRGGRKRRLGRKTSQEERDEAEEGAGAIPASDDEGAGRGGAGVDVAGGAVQERGGAERARGGRAKRRLGRKTSEVEAAGSAAGRGARKRRLGRKTSEVEAAGAGAGRGATEDGRAGEDAAGAARASPTKRRRLGRKTSADERAVAGGAERPAAEEGRGGAVAAEMAELSASEREDERSASDHEVASEDDVALPGEVRGALDAELVRFAGAGPPAEADEAEALAAEGADGRASRRSGLPRGGGGGDARAWAVASVPHLKERRLPDLVKAVREYLLSRRGCNPASVRIQGSDGDTLWGALMEPGRPGRFGRVLLELEDRARGRGPSEERSSWEEIAVEEDFRCRSDWPRVRFECSMLQTPVVGEGGATRWRAVRCCDEPDGGDADDFQALWQRESRVAAGFAANVVRDDDVVVLPAERPAGWMEPAHMAGAWWRGQGPRERRAEEGRNPRRVWVGQLHEDAGVAGLLAEGGAGERTAKEGLDALQQAGQGARGAGRAGRGRGRPARKRKRYGNDLRVVVRSRWAPSDRARPGNMEVFVFGGVPEADHWEFRPQAELRDVFGSSGSLTRKLNHRARLAAGDVAQKCMLLALKTVPLRVAKYDVQLRDASVRAVQAAQAILTRMVKFTCHECQERFPAFHPAFEPPDQLADEMLLLRRGGDGLAACSTEVAEWDEVPPSDPPDGFALECAGVCMRCRRDLDKQAAAAPTEDDLYQVVGLRTAQNHMDPCFRFPWHDLEDLFQGATMVEGMLVALEHMQVNFVTISSGMTKFRRNSLSFPQDIVGFAQRQQLMKNYTKSNLVPSLGEDHLSLRNLEK